MTDRVSVQKWFIITYTTYNDWYMIDCHLKIKTSKNNKSLVNVMTRDSIS